MSDGNVAIRVSGVSRHFDDTTAVDDVSLDVVAGSTMALLGPSGCGKTTLLRIIAGLETPDTGTVTVDGRVVFDAKSDVSAHERGVGLVFQDGALFPHMTVLDNVAYGLGKHPDIDRARAALKLVDLPDVEARMPHTLSGGQQQRVALARALAPEPSVLLLDEPLASLDTDLRTRIRAEMAELLRTLEITAVFVTHDQEEAFAVGDTAAVMRGGSIRQVGTPTELYQSPATPWVAKFVGEANLIGGTAHGGTAETSIGSIPIAVARTGECQVLVRPEHIRVTERGEAVVESVEFHGHDTSYAISVNGNRVSARAMSTPRFAQGDAVGVSYGGPPTVAFGPE